MPEKELSAIEILDEINRNLSPEKATRAAVLVPKLREAIGNLEERCDGLYSTNEGLHRRCGDKPVCDKCGGDVMLTDCAAVCGKCENERIEKEKIDVQNADNYFPLSVEWHWEEKKVSK